MRVMAAADMIEKHINVAVEPLECARDAANAALGTPNLPDYVKRRFYRVIWEIERAISTKGHLSEGNLYASVKAIRDGVPKDDLEAEQRRASFGTMQSMV